MDPFLTDLTPNQLEAVTNIHGPSLVIAGAGSGKTRVITKRIAHMIQQGISADNILAITFTNKAAKEMAERVAHFVEGRRPVVSTFHSFCARVLREKAELAGLTSTFVIYDTSDARSALKHSILDLNLDPKTYEPNKISFYISDAKNKMVSIEELEKEAHHEKAKNVVKIFKRYQEYLRECNATDFDDLLLLVIKVWMENPVVLEEYQERYQYLLVDEYQDTNLPQNQIVTLLSQKYRNVCVTGDPDQTIYSWRGANINNINQFPDWYPNTKIINLEQNFRSTNTILKAANAVIRNNHRRYEKELFSELGDGELIQVVKKRDEEDEADFISQEILKLKNSGKEYKNMAIFYRTNGQSRPIEDALRRDNIPYTIVGGVKFYDRAEIKDILAYLRLIVNGRDNVSLLRVINNPTRGIGPKAIQDIRDVADAKNVCLAEALTMPQLEDYLSPKALSGVKSFLHIFSEVYKLGDQAKVSEIIELIYQKSGYKAQLEKDEFLNEDRISNVEALVNAAAEQQAKHDHFSPAQFLESVALIADVDQWEDKKERVTLMTLHSAKGLEFENVFMAGLEQELLPHKNSMGDDSQFEEERRLCYVGITRAMRKLTMTHALSRLQWGNRNYTQKSTFLREIPETLIHEIGGERPGYSSHNQGFSLMNQWSQVSPENEVDEEFEEDVLAEEDFAQESEPPVEVKQGDMVKHPKFGKGVVMSVLGEGNFAKISIIFESYGKKDLIAEYANLLKL